MMDMFFQDSEIDDDSRVIQNVGSHINLHLPVVSVKTLAGPTKCLKLMGSREMGDYFKFKHGSFQGLKTLKPAKYCRQAEPVENALAVMVQSEVFQNISQVAPHGET
jgi:hypothetical protein